MTKKEIVKIIAERANLPQLKTKQIVQWTFDAIIETLLSEKRIELRNFGVFEVKRRKPRKARNPRTDEQVMVAAKNVVTFQPGKEMEERVKSMPLVEEKVRKPRRMRSAAAAQPAPTPAVEAPMPSVADSPVNEPMAENGQGGTNGADARKRVRKEV